MAKYSYRWLFRGDAATAAIYAGIILVTIRETLPRLVKVADPPGGDKTAEGATEVEKSISLPKTVQHIISDRAFVAFTVATLLMAMVFMQHLSTFPLYLSQFVIGPDIFGRLISLNAIMVVLLQLPVTSLVSRFHRGR